MKNLKFVAAGLFAVLGMTSCQSDESVNSQSKDMVPLDITTGIVTRSGITATQFANGESLGLYIYRGDGIASATEYADQSGMATKNVAYTEAAGQWKSLNGIILSNVLGTVYAYYPHSATNDANDGKTIAVQVNADQQTGQSDGVKDANGQTDYMWADPVENVSNKVSQIHLAFNHALAKVSFRFKQSTEDADLYPGIGKVTSIVLKNEGEGQAIKTGNATLHIGDGSLDLSTATAGSITLSGIETATLMDATAAETTPSLLLYPNTGFDENTVKATMTIDGSAYTVALPKLENGYQAGKNYVYTFTLKGTGLDENAISVEIKAWEDVTQEGGVISTPDA